MNAAIATTTTMDHDWSNTQYYITAEIKPDGTTEIIGDENVPSLEPAHGRQWGQVKFLRSVNQRRKPYGKVETKPLLRALAAWPMEVLKYIAAARYGVLGQEAEAMPRGLRPPKNDDDGLIEAVNRCALNMAGDEDRVLLARKNKSSDTMLGPCELVECDKHPGCHKLHRWTWDVPSDGDHASAIECSDPDIVRSCPKCIEEDDAHLDGE